MVQVAAEHGYAQLTVGKVLAASGVSRATFYQHFCNVDECFRSAYRHHAEQLLRKVARQCRRTEFSGLAVLDTLVDFAVTRPEAARVLMIETLASGPAGILERDSLISSLAQAATAPGADHVGVDLPTTIMIGGVFRFLYIRLLEGGASDGLRGEVRAWAEVFAHCTSQPLWFPNFVPALPRDALRPYAPLGKPRRCDAPRERILHGTAATVLEKGYRDAAVADIVSRAGVSRRGF
ncbi:MAG TPA: TetR/AcrR family transcriptional regulator [Solirubrobacteraceae bacterium]|nr:TetR/AcrR family transcriptional regulator [Solirubrobacteraceae bacterium]